MITQNVRMPRWRAVVLCLAGVLAMTRPLASGVSLYRASLPVPVKNYSSLYGWVEDAGPFNSNERWRAERRLRVLGYPRSQFATSEIDEAAAEVRALGLGEIRRLRLEEDARSRRASADRGVALLLSGIGAGGMLFYVWLGYTLLHEPQFASINTPRTHWFGKKRRHGRITFGRLAA